MKGDGPGLDLALVRETASRLFDRIDPTRPVDAATIALRELPHVYPQSVLAAVDKRTSAAVENRGHLYLRGAQPGVGLSWYLADYARSYNYYMARQGDPRRILYVQLPRGLSTEIKLLDALGTAARAMLHISELRFRSSLTLEARILDALRLHRVSVLVLDHVHKLQPGVRDLVADLMLAGNPVSRAALEIDEYAGVAPRLGILLAADRRPEKLFDKSSSEVLRLLRGREVVYPTYTTAADTADALRQADIGLADLDTSELRDALIAEYVFELTRGRVYLLEPFLQTVDWLMRTNTVTRPGLEIFLAAAPFEQALRERLLTRRDPHPDGKGWADLCARAERLAAGEPVALRERRTLRVESASRAPRKASPKEIHAGRDLAERQRQKIVEKPRTRKRHR